MYLIGDADSRDNFNPDQFINFVDAVSPYVLYAEIDEDYPAQSHFLNNLSVALHQQQLSTGDYGIKFIPCVFPGFNNRSVGFDLKPWPRQKAESDNHTSAFESIIKVSRPFIDQDLNMIMITSWNEWHEDSQIEPVIKLPPTQMDISGAEQYHTFGYEYNGYGFDNLKVVSELLGGGLTVPIEQTYLKTDHFLELYPNPTSEVLHLNWQLPIRSNALIRIYNQLGEMVDQKVIHSPRDKTYSLSLENLHPGIYFCRFDSDGTSSTIKFVVD